MKLERPLPVDGQGPRITELWAWCAIDPMTDTEGVVAATLPGVGAVPLVSTMRRMADELRPFAEGAVRSAEEPKPTVRLRRFVPVEPDEEL